MAKSKRSNSSCASTIIAVGIGIFLLAMIAQCTGGSAKTNRLGSVKTAEITLTPTITETPIPSPTWTPFYTRTPDATKTAYASACHDPSCGCVIKGNINDGKKIYHCPNSPVYDSVKINRPGERYFCTEQEAIEAGFVLTGNTKHCIIK